MTTTLGERFALVRKHFGGSQREVAEQFQVSKNSWQRYEAGDVPNGTTLMALAAAGIDTNWLLTGAGSMLLPVARRENANGFSELEPLPVSGKALQDLGYVLIPRYDVRASAGGGAYADEQLIGSVAFTREWLHRALRANPADLVIVEAAGDSMPGSADDRDILLVDTSEPKLRGNGVYVFLVDNLLLVKNLRLKLDGAIEISGNGQSEAPEIFARNALDRLKIIGRVIWRAGRA